MNCQNVYSDKILKLSAELASMLILSAILMIASRIENLRLIFYCFHLLRSAMQMYYLIMMVNK